MFAERFFKGLLPCTSIAVAATAIPYVLDVAALRCGEFFDSRNRLLGTADESRLAFPCPVANPTSAPTPRLAAPTRSVLASQENPVSCAPQLKAQDRSHR